MEICTSISKDFISKSLPSGDNVACLTKNRKFDVVRVYG